MSGLLNTETIDAQRYCAGGSDRAVSLESRYERSLASNEPAVVTALAAECGLSEAQAQLAWRRLRERAWVETIPVALRGAAERGRLGGGGRSSPARK